MLDQPALEFTRFAWTDEIVARLRDLYGQGLSASQIGMRLQTSRNAIIGKVHRLGMPRRGPSMPRPRAAKPTQPSKPRHTVHKHDQNISLAGMRPLPIMLKPIAPLRKDEVPADGKPCSLVELSSNGCKWVVDDKHYLFCNHQQQDQKPYCPHHTRLSINPIQPRARNVIPSLKRRVA